MASLLWAGAFLLPSFVVYESRASLWESPTWALIGDVQGTAGYDSNIFGRKDGDGDAYVIATPTLSLLRKASVSYLRLDLSAQGRRYFDFSDQSTVDPSLRIVFRFPEVEDALTSQEFVFNARTRSYVNLQLGERSETREVNGGWEGTIRDTGKTQILGRLGGAYVDYDQYGTENLLSYAGLGLGWFRTELMQLYANYVFEHEEVTSSRADVGESQRDSHGINLGIRGELSPKLKGSANLGLRNNKFTGRLESSEWDWFSSADLTWRLHERQSFTLGAGRTNNFDPRGDPYTSTNIDLALRQGVTNTLTAIGRVGWMQFTYVGGVGALREARADSRFRVGGTLNYVPSSRFDAGVSVDWYSKDSDFRLSGDVPDPDIYSFSEYTVSVSARYRF